MGYYLISSCAVFNIFSKGVVKMTFIATIQKVGDSTMRFQVCCKTSGVQKC